MVITVLTYKQELSEVEKYLEEHRKYLDNHYSLGKFIASGPRNPRTGGIILMNVTKEEAQLLVEKDPFFINDIADYELIEFFPTKYHIDLKKIIE